MNFGLAAAVHFRELRPLELTTSCTSPLFLWILLTSVMPGLRPKLVYIYANYFEFYKETNLSCLLSSLSHRDDAHAVQIFIAHPQSRVVSLYMS